MRLSNIKKYCNETVFNNAFFNSNFTYDKMVAKLNFLNLTNDMKIDVNRTASYRLQDQSVQNFPLWFHIKSSCPPRKSKCESSTLLSIVFPLLCRVPENFGWHAGKSSDLFITDRELFVFSKDYVLESERIIIINFVSKPVKVTQKIISGAEVKGQATQYLKSRKFQWFLQTRKIIDVMEWEDQELLCNAFRRF